MFTTRRAVHLALSLALIAAPGAHAAVVDGATTAQASLGWSELDVILPDGMEVLFIDPQQTRGGVGADVAEASIPSLAPTGDWTTSQTSSFTGFAGSNASYSFDDMNLEVGAGSDGGTAVSLSNRLGGLQFSGPEGSQVQITLPYRFDLTADQGTLSNVFASLEIQAFSPGGSSQVFPDTVALSSTGGDRVESAELSVLFSFSSFDTYFIAADVSAEVAVVPLPAAGLLFASGLVLLRRRRRCAS